MTVKVEDSVKDRRRPHTAPFIKAILGTPFFSVYGGDSRCAYEFG
jgi:hypothetical protein